MELFYFCSVSKQFTLGKNERLKSRKLIERVLKEGHSFNSFPFRVSYLIEKKIATDLKVTPVTQFTAAVSSKNFKKAVERNRIKRLMREAWRLQKPALIGKIKEDSRLYVFIIFTGKELPDYTTIYDKTGLILIKLVKAIYGTGASTT